MNDLRCVGNGVHGIGFANRSYPSPDPKRTRLALPAMGFSTITRLSSHFIHTFPSVRNTAMTGDFDVLVRKRQLDRLVSYIQNFPAKGNTDSSGSRSFEGRR